MLEQAYAASALEGTRAAHLTLIRSSALFLVACVTLSATAVTQAASSVQQQSCPSPLPSAETDYWAPVATPRLPTELQDNIKSKERSLRDLLESVPRPEQIAPAAAEMAVIVELRKRYEGEDWWETIDAKWMLTGFRRLATLTPAQWKRLKASYAYTEREELPSYAEELTRCNALRELLGNDYPEYAKCLVDSYSDDDSMDSSKAEKTLQAAIEIYRKSLGTHHPDYAEGLRQLAGLRPDDYSSSELRCLYAQQIEILKTSGKSSGYITTLKSVARYYAHEAEYPIATAALLEAIALYTDVGKHSYTIVEGGKLDTLGYLYDSLAKVYEGQGDFPKAEAYYRKALDTYQAAQQDKQRAYACTESDLADTLAKDNQAADAAAVFLDLIHRTFQLWVTEFPTLNFRGKDSLVNRETRCNFDRQSSIDRLFTLVFFKPGVPKELGISGAIYSKQLAYYAAQQENIAMISAFAANPTKWKADWDDMRRLRREYQAMTLPNFSSEVLASAFRQNVAQVRKVNLVARRIAELDKRLRKDGSAYKRAAQLSEITVDDVRAALGPQQALIEYVTFHPADFTHSRQRTAAHYGAFLVRSGVQEILAIDLGEASQIDALVEGLRGRESPLEKFIALAGPNEQEVATSERAIGMAVDKLQARVWQPFANSLQNYTRVFVAADGSINLIPFEIFSRTDQAGHFQYLIENKEILYVGSARDLAQLARSALKSSHERRAILIGNPAFSATTKVVAQNVARLGSATVNTLVAQRVGADSAGAQLGDAQVNNYLPEEWSEDVGSALDRLLSRADKALRSNGWTTQLIEGEGAVEEAVEYVDSPAILQIATHGYFQKPLGELPAYLQDPLLRSMLIFAGVNTWKSSNSVFYKDGGRVVSASERSRQGQLQERSAASPIRVGDGILTALQVSSINLHNTLLVHLTACETGVGDVTAEGVAGLRQAFLMAGARAVTMSMWTVPADESVEEMVNFYQHWLSDSQPDSGMIPARRYRAFREAELDALRSARDHNGGSGHPFYWAGFVYYGDPGDFPHAEPATVVTGSTSH